MSWRPFAKPGQRSMLTIAAQRSLAGPLFAATLCVLLATLLAGSAASALVGDATAESVLVVAGSALVVGLLAALIAARFASAAIAGIAVRPIEIVLEQLDAGDLESFRWQQGRALVRSEIDGDIRLLQRRIREVTRNSRMIIEELETAREQACEQNLAKSQFLANMSHELRTPLNAILGYAMLLHEDASDAGNVSVMSDLGRIQEAGRNLLALINDILDLAKIETGRMSVDRAVIDVALLAAGVAGSHQQAAKANGNRFELKVHPDIGIMVGDLGKLRQCLSCLLTNAFKFTRDGRVELAIAPIERDGSPWIEFAVRDTGIGIGPRDVERLFDPFQQAEVGSARKYGGTGLGLAIVQRLAGMMGGECNVVSVPEKGSTFRLLLPLVDSAAADRVEGPETGSAVANFVATRDAVHTALVVDDDEAAVELMQRWLVRMGYSVLSTTSGETVLDLARLHRPDFILLDALLPRRSGYQLLEELRADPEIGDIPTILITVDDDRARGLKAGATDYLSKPITEKQLRDVLDVYRLRATGDILVIDDDDDSAELVVRSVAQVGFSARRAVDGVEGLRMANDNRPDAIVLDLAMPEMDGFELLRRLAASVHLRDIPLIVVSGCDISIEQHRRLADAGHRFFAKAASTPREIAQSLKELVA